MNDYPSRVTLFEDGVFRWSYDMDMWRNGFMLRHVLKILAAVCALLCFTMQAAFGWDRMTPLSVATFFLIPMGALSALTLLIYLISALAMRGNYHLRFEMDESAIALVQSSSTTQRNRALASIAVGVGILAGQRNKAYRVGATLGAANSVGTTAFSDVTRFKAHPGDDVIALREWFFMNQIYVPKEDYAFVRDFILARIPERARRRARL